MSKKDTNFNYQLRYCTVQRLTDMYSDLIKRVKGYDIYFYVAQNKELMSYQSITTAVTNINPSFKYLQQYFKSVCGNTDKSAERYKYYYLKTICKAYEQLLGYTIDNWACLRTLIGICASVSSIAEDTDIYDSNNDNRLITPEIIGDINNLTLYITALFILQQKLDGYEEIILDCLKDEGIALAIKAIIDSNTNGTCNNTIDNGDDNE